MPSLKPTMVFLVLALAGVAYLGRIAFFAVTPARSGSPVDVILEVRKGESPNELGRLLAAQGAVSNSRLFVWVGRLTHQRIKAGEYKVTTAMTPIEIYSVITSGISLPHPVTVREGENMYEIAADLEAKGLAKKADCLALCRNPKFIATLQINSASLEGYLYPDTYFFNKTMTAEDMLRQMVKHFHQSWGPGEESQAKALGLTQNQAITLASIIEKETGAPQERPIISSVFHNRLRKRMKLQSDPTTIYGMWERYTGNIHRSDLLAANPYNTYYVPALPVGPISNPGKDAIEAALHPAQTEFLFFVSHNDGTHQFSRSLGEHNLAVQKFQLNPKAREGKSWRNLYQTLHPKKPPATSGKS